LMHFLAGEGAVRRGGFIHIPYLPEQAARHPGEPSMGLTTIVRGLELAIEAVMTVLDRADYWDAPRVRVTLK